MTHHLCRAWHRTKDSERDDICHGPIGLLCVWSIKHLLEWLLMARICSDFVNLWESGRCMPLWAIFLVCLPSFPAERPSGLVMPVLFFRRCFLRLAWGDGGGSSLGLVALLMPEAELRGSDMPLAGGKKREMKFSHKVFHLWPFTETTHTSLQSLTPCMHSKQGWFLKNG